METCCDVEFGAGGTDEKEGGWVENVKLPSGSDQDGEDLNWVKLRFSGLETVLEKQGWEAEVVVAREWKD